MAKEAKIAETLWDHLDVQEKDAEKIDRPSLTFWQDGWMRLCRNKVAMVSMFYIICIALGSIFIPFFWQYSYERRGASGPAGFPPDPRGDHPAPGGGDSPSRPPGDHQVGV